MNHQRRTSHTERSIQTNMSTPIAQTVDMAPGDFTEYLDHCGGLHRLQNLCRQEQQLPAML